MKDGESSETKGKKEKKEKKEKKDLKEKEKHKRKENEKKPEGKKRKREVDEAVSKKSSFLCDISRFDYS